MYALTGRRAFSTITLAVISTAFAACKDSSTSTAPAVPVAANVIAVNGVGQTSRVGALLSDSLSLLITTADGSPVSGVAVAWSVAKGGGALSATTTTTDATGHTAVAYTAGNAPGTAAIIATAATLSPFEFDATLVPGAPSTMLADASDPKSLTIGAPATPLEVKLTDSFGNAIANYPVLWNIATGDSGDALSTFSSMTDINGLATVTFAPDSVTGPRTISASTPEGVTVMLNFSVDSASASTALRAAVKR